MFSRSVILHLIFLFFRRQQICVRINVIQNTQMCMSKKKGTTVNTQGAILTFLRASSLFHPLFEPLANSPYLKISLVSGASNKGKVFIFGARPSYETMRAGAFFSRVLFSFKFRLAAARVTRIQFVIAHPMLGCGVLVNEWLLANVIFGLSDC